MKIQSLSVCVPGKSCINNCKFCVSRMHCEDYKNNLDGNLPFYDLYLEDYLKRLQFTRENGCNTVILTGNCEPQQNRAFLQRFGELNARLPSPFHWIEMQTTGRLLDSNYLRFLRNHVGVTTIALSVSSFDEAENAEICGMSEPVRLKELCEEIRKYDFNLRICVNLTKSFNEWIAEGILKYCRDVLKADQVTFRILYSSGSDTEQDKWIAVNKASDSKLLQINNYVTRHGNPLGILEYGQIKYDIFGMSIVIDGDCMSKELTESYKYLILRPDCRLYSQWDSKASRIF